MLQIEVVHLIVWRFRALISLFIKVICFREKGGVSYATEYSYVAICPREKGGFSYTTEYSYVAYFTPTSFFMNFQVFQRCVINLSCLCLGKPKSDPLFNTLPNFSIPASTLHKLTFGVLKIGIIIVCVHLPPIGLPVSLCI